MISLGVVITVYLVSLEFAPSTELFVILQLYYMWMSEQLQILYFPFNSSCHISRDELSARYDFQSDLLATDSVDRQLDLAKGTLS